MSDHLPIFASMKLSNSKKNVLHNTYRRFFSDSKEDKFVKCLEKNLSDINYDLNPNEVMDNILLSTKNAINEIFPIKKVSRKQAQLIQNPWISNDIFKEGKFRDLNYKENLLKVETGKTTKTIKSRGTK